MNQAVKTSKIPSVKYLKIIFICLAGFAIAYILRSHGNSLPSQHFLPLHLVLEYSSIVVSFALFCTGWVGYKQTENSRDLILALTFMVAGAVDFIHTLSYRGMPDFLGTNMVGKAAAYWLVARLVVGAGLLLAAYIRPGYRSKWISANAMAAISAVAIVVIVALFTAYGTAVSNMLYDTRNQALLPLKIALEYITIFAYLGAFTVITENREWNKRSVDILRSAIIYAIFAELAFTGYKDPYGWLNMLGHVFKTTSYYLILNSLFVSAIIRPYEQLSKAKEELQALYLDAREHRKEIERSFAQIGSALSSSLDLEAALDQISELAVDMLHADCSVVVSLKESGKDVHLTAQRGTCHDPHRPLDLALQIGKDAISKNSSITFNDIESLGIVPCDFKKADCLRSMVCAPMTYEGRALGLIVIYSHKANSFENGDVKLLEAFATHSAVAIHNALSFARESRIADVLQRSLLTTATLVTDKYEIAQVYKSAANEALVGGDFYDVIKLPGERIAIAIGDVSGKGLQAAVHTAMLKYTLRAYLSEGHGPSEAADLLNKAVTQATNSETFVTMFFGIIDPAKGELTYINAGHEPPIYSLNGSITIIDSTGPALGLGMLEGFEERKIRLEPESTLLLYTDGISEARRGREFLGTEKIGEIVVNCQGISSEDVAKCVHSQALDFAGGALKDDVAILALRAL